MSDIDFLPENYDLPQGSYMKLEAGENKFRILSRPVVGWMDWDNEKKPHRFRMNQKPLVPMGKDPIKHFWAMKVYNYKNNAIQVLEITQKGIMSSIKALAEDIDWGNPLGYNIKITKEGDGKNTEYHVNPAPKSEVDSMIKELSSQTYCELDALFSNKDPFIPVDRASI